MAHRGLQFKLLQKDTTVIIAIYVGMPSGMNFNSGINSHIYLGFRFTKNKKKKKGFKYSILCKIKTE